MIINCCSLASVSGTWFTRPPRSPGWRWGLMPVAVRPPGRRHGARGSSEPEGSVSICGLLSVSSGPPIMPKWQGAWHSAGMWGRRLTELVCLDTMISVGATPGPDAVSGTHYTRPPPIPGTAVGC